MSHVLIRDPFGKRFSNLLIQINLLLAMSEKFEVTYQSSFSPLEKPPPSLKKQTKDALSSSTLRYTSLHRSSFHFSRY
jgi:hypothetical protein